MVGAALFLGWEGEQVEDKDREQKLTAEQKARLLAHFKEIQEFQKQAGLESDGPRNRGEE